MRFFLFDKSASFSLRPWHLGLFATLHFLHRFKFMHYWLLFIFSSMHLYPPTLIMALKELCGGGQTTSPSARQTSSSSFMTASWVEEQLVSPESIPLRIARRHENSSRQSPEKLIKIKLAFFMTWLTHPQHRLMKVSFCLISSWLKAASLCWLPFLSQTRFPVTHLRCPLSFVLPGTRSKEWPKHYLVKTPRDYVLQRILRVELLFLQKCRDSLLLKIFLSLLWHFHLKRAPAVTERQQNKFNSLPHQPPSARVNALCSLLLL